MKRILILLALAAAAFAGCIGEESIAGGEVKLRMGEAIGGVESYRFEINMDQTVEFANFEGEGSLEGERVTLRWTGAINLTDQSFVEVSRSNRTDLSGLATAEDVVEVYFLNNTRYQKMGEEWIGLLQPGTVYGTEMNDKLANLMEMIDRTEMVAMGTERIEGQELYRLKVIPDNDTAYGIMLGQISSIDPRIPLMIDMNALFEKGAQLEWTILVSKETGLPTESRISTVYTAGPGILRMPPESAQGLEIRFETEEVRRFGGFGEPVVVELPEEARAAPILTPDLPAGESSSPV